MSGGATGMWGHGFDGGWGGLLALLSAPGSPVVGGAQACLPPPQACRHAGMRWCQVPVCALATGLAAHTTVHHALRTRSRRTDSRTAAGTATHSGGTYLLQGHEHRPQNCPRLFKFFSASFMSLLIWSIPSSMRSSCSDYQHNVIFPTKE